MSVRFPFRSFTRVWPALLVVLLVTAPLWADSQTRNANFTIVNNGAEWVSPTSAQGAPDDECAGSSTPTGSWIQFSFPNFSLPSGATVTGIQAGVKYLAPSGSNSVRLTQSGAPLGEIKSIAAASGVSNCASTSLVSAGGDGDLWQTVLTAAHFNLGRVGFRLTQDANTVDIDAVELTVFFEGGSENQPPLALCRNVSALAAAGQCQAAVNAAQVDNGSSDPDNDPISLSLSPAGPFPVGGTAVTLTVSDDGGAQDSCSATVTVLDDAPPLVSCGAPATITPPDAPVTFSADAQDSCQGAVAAQVTDFDCFWINPAGKRVDKTGSCQVSANGGSIVIEDAGGVGNTIEWTVEAQDASGNLASQTCSVEVVRPGKGKKLEELNLDHLLDFAQFGAGDGLTSEMILHNPSERRPVQGLIHLLDAEGAPLQVLPHVDGQILRADGDWSAVPFSIPPLGHFSLDAVKAKGLRTGSASVRSDGPVAGVVRFTIPGLGTAVLPGSQPVSEALASVRLSPGSNTGTAIRNTEEHPITLSLALRDREGQPVPGAETELTLQPGARRALLLDELFGDLPQTSFRGELEIRSQDGSFVAVVLEFGSQPGSFTALPVTPLVKDKASQE